MFITFEGIEGSGKTTQVKKLSAYLKEQGKAVLLTREPGGVPIANDIRNILLDAGNAGMDPLCELLLYNASRVQHIKELILPALKNGQAVLCDRFVDATVAYQGYGRNLDADTINSLNDLVLKDFRIDLTVLFDLPVEQGLERARARIEALSGGERKEDRFENEVVAFHERVRQGYLDLAAKNPQRFCVVDASLGVEELFQEVLVCVKPSLGL